MWTKSKLMSAALALTAFSTLATVSLTAAPAEAAAVHCKRRRAAGLRGSHAPVVVAPVREIRSRDPGHRAARRLYQRQPLWCAARRLHPRVALKQARSAGNGVAVGKAAGQCEPDACPAGAGGELELRAAARGAASMLRKPRAVCRSAAAVPSAASAKPLLSSSMVMQPRGLDAPSSVSMLTVMRRGRRRA